MSRRFKKEEDRMLCDELVSLADLLVINKIDLAPLVGASLEVMEADARRMRSKKPFVFTNLKSGEGADQVARFVLENGGLAKLAA